MQEITYKINCNMISCKTCGKSYKLRKNGTPPVYFTNHMMIYHGFSEEECINFRSSFNLTHFTEVKPDVISNESHGECSICFEEMYSSEIPLIPCKHEFHLSCLKRMPNDNCPLCRQNMNINVGVLNQSMQAQLSRDRLIQEQEETLRLAREQQEQRDREYAEIVRRSQETLRLAREQRERQEQRNREHAELIANIDALNRRAVEVIRDVQEARRDAQEARRDAQEVLNESIREVRNSIRVNEPSVQDAPRNRPSILGRIGRIIRMCVG